MEKKPIAVVETFECNITINRYASRQLLREDCNKIKANLNVASQSVILKGVKSAA